MSRKTLSYAAALMGALLSICCVAQLLEASTTTTAPHSIASTAITAIPAPKESKKTTSQQVDSMQDLERLAAMPDGRQHTLVDEELASANQQSLIFRQRPSEQSAWPLSFDGPASPVPSQSQMPAGLRRLDDMGTSMSLDARLGEPESLVAAGAANRESRRHKQAKYSHIVDNGPQEGELWDARNLSPELVAKLASDDYNRIALASAMRFQQSAARRQFQRRQMAPASEPGNPRLGDEPSQPWPISGRASQRRSGGGRVGGARGRQSAQRKRGNGAISIDEHDELNSRSGGAVRSEEADEDEDEDAGENSAASTSDRRNSDPVFGDLDSDKRDEELEALDGNEGDHEMEAGGARGGVARSQRQRGGRVPNYARSASRQSQRRQASAGRRQMKSDGIEFTRKWSRPAGGYDNGEDEGDVDDIESMNSRVRHLIRAEPPGERFSGLADEQQASQFARRHDVQLSVTDKHNGDERSEPRRKLASEQYVVGDLALNDIARDADSRQQADSRARARRKPARGAGDDDDAAKSASHVRHSATDLQTAAGHHHNGHHGHYYQYVEVPKKKAWKFGFKRGNHKHTIERHEKGHKHKFHTEFKWHAKEKCKKGSKCKSVGKMTWDYKHHDKKHHGY